MSNPVLNKNNKNNQKKFDIKKIKNNTVKSLNDIENFLQDFNNFKKYIYLYKILKK